jgi:hypothetical protein
MAIKRKDTTGAAPSLPSDFLAHCRKAFSLQQISGLYKDGFDAEKGWLLEYLEKNTEGVSIEAGKAIKVPEGQLVFKTTVRFDINTAKLEELVKAGEISLATVLAVATFSAEKLKTALGEARFGTLATPKPSESLALTATPDFKREVEETFSTRSLVSEPALPTFPAAMEAASAEPAPKAFTRKPKVDPAPVADPARVAAERKEVSSSLEKAKAAAAKGKAKSVQVQDDLDAILKGK